MATTNTGRITKDTSARKTSNIPADIEAKAKEDYYNTIIAGLQEQGEKQLQDQETAHTEAIASLKEQLDKKDATHATQRKQLTEAAAAKVRASFATTVTQLQTQVSNLTATNKQLQTTVDEEIAKKEESNRNSQREGARFQTQLVNLKTAHASDIADLQKQLATNSWVEVHFTGHGFKDRKYVLRPSTSFKEAVKELLRATGCSYNDFEFRVGAQEITNGRLTLDQLGIKDGVKVAFGRMGWFEKLGRGRLDK